MSKKGRMKKRGYRYYPPAVWTEIEYHNKQIYQNYSFFLKVILAIVGGLAYLGANYAKWADLEKVFNIASFLVLVNGIWTVTAIAFHIKARRKRYGKNIKGLFPALFKMGDTYLMLTILLISVVISIYAFTWF